MAAPATTSSRGGTRDRLLDAAERVLSERGATALTLEAVALVAEVSKGGLLYHFPTKEKLIEALVTRAVARVDEGLAVASASTEPGAFARAYLDITVPARPPAPAPNAAATLPATLLGAVSLNPVFLRPLRDAYARWQRRLEDDGIDPATATVVRLAVDGWWMATVLDLPPLSASTHRKARDLLLRLTVPKEPNR
jgi:AcrR family transcriptional regulator